MYLTKANFNKEIPGRSIPGKPAGVPATWYLQGDFTHHHSAHRSRIDYATQVDAPVLCCHLLPWDFFGWSLKGSANGKRGRIRTYEVFSDHTCTQVQTRRFTVPCFGRLRTLLYYLDNVVSIALFRGITSDPQALQRCQQNRTLSVPYATWNLFRITLHVGQ